MLLVLTMVSATIMPLSVGAASWDFDFSENDLRPDGQYVLTVIGPDGNTVQTIITGGNPSGSIEAGDGDSSWSLTPIGPGNSYTGTMEVEPEYVPEVTPPPTPSPAPSPSPAPPPPPADTPTHDAPDADPTRLRTDPSNIYITNVNTSLTATVQVLGEATGTITYDRRSLPEAVTLVIDQYASEIFLEGTPPAMGQPAIVGVFPVTVRRDGSHTTLRVHVNLVPPTQVVDAPPADDPDPQPQPTPQPPIQVLPWGATPAHLLFDDVAQTAWYHDYVTTLVHHGIFQGTGYRTFSPQANMTRAMFAQALANLEGVNLAPYTIAEAAFNDVYYDSWYFPAVQWAYTAGLIQGVGGGNFNPGANVTREQIAVLLHRYASSRGIWLPQGPTATFTDQANISYWAADAVAAIQQAGIIQGRPGGEYDPLGTATRAELAALFARFLPMARQ